MTSLSLGRWTAKWSISRQTRSWKKPPEGEEPYYRVQIRIAGAQYESRAKDIVIKPGMTASVDIKAMERTVLSYLTKPITKTLSEGLGER